ncbi:MAG TPA: helix-turn-helix domain-containing protein [candidate division Zixibacteria bacterium]|nr:helix-turn-helix domain-containing protein [candidate division Zixibacteria bacterium]
MQSSQSTGTVIFAPFAFFEVRFLYYPHGSQDTDLKGEFSNMIEELKKLGLTGYEPMAYLTLLKLGDAKANEIAINARIPMGRIYNVLSSLEEARLIRVQDTRPKRYACVEPGLSLEILSKNKQEELKHAAAELDILVKDMASELSNAITINSAKCFWNVAKEEGSLELVREHILSAKKELLFFIACRDESERIKKEVMDNIKRYSEILKGLKKTIKKGVAVKVILNGDVDFSSFEDFPEIIRLLMDIGKGLDCRFAAIPATPFGIIDGENLTLEMRNPLNPGEILVIVSIRDTKLAEDFREKFFNIWEKAEAL